MEVAANPCAGCGLSLGLSDCFPPVPFLLHQVICHAVACSETEPIAQLVARQRSSKRKTGRQVNCQMRLKNTSPVKLAGKPKGTLRQPRSLSVPEEGSKRPVPRLPRSRGVACGVVKPTVESARLALSPAAGSGSPKETPMQRHVTVVNRTVYKDECFGHVS
ncbi:tudor domain-containing protein 7-like [Strigops habroptila]|uniref:tudor domain-containing protein 7-like n=1 Tax=Strigops habroptila TaxID=2489341 RepID=UPI0011CF6FBE|nr:tudor domain-containing protein 7-like [Strigops habroptila]